jgi:hypothetical protein
MVASPRRGACFYSRILTPETPSAPTRCGLLLKKYGENPGLILIVPWNRDIDKIESRHFKG